MSNDFCKMTGSGNDFIVLDGRDTTESEWPPERIVAICDRRHGVGADGLIIVSPEGDGAARMIFFNNDGSRAPMCGNGALCSTRFASLWEMTDPGGMNLVTDAGTYRTRCVGEQHLAELHLLDTPVPVAVDVARLPGEQWLGLGRVGGPHLVVLVDDIEAVDVMQRGRELRFHPACGPDGANVNFASRIHNADPGDSTAPRWAIRTYERGVEGETLACGTGTVASALAIADQGLDQLPGTFRTRSGRTLAVNATVSGGQASNIWLCGEGRLVACGEWLE